MMNSEYYDALGVSSSATKEEIQKAYRKLARKYHPDMNKDSGAEDRFKLINEAHSVLADPEKRKLYDRYGQNWRDAQQQEGQEQRSNSERQRSNFAGGFHFEQGGNPYEQEDFSDIFSEIFGSGGHREGQWSGYNETSGRTVEAELEVSLEELVHGGSKTISWNSMERAGRSIRPVEQKVQLKIPKGLKHGSVIRLAGKGEKTSTQGEAGDLLLRVTVRPHKKFTLKDYDLLTTVPIAPWEAALGCKVEVETINGTINLTIPKGCGTGRKMRVKGKGVPRKTGGAGDLLVRIEVQVPKNLSDEEKELFQQLQKKSSFNPRNTRGQRAEAMQQAA